MYFKPNYKFEVVRDSDYVKDIVALEESLSKIQNSGYFFSFDKKKLYYEYFLCENADKTIVIVHGLSEFTKKYYEFAYYFLNQGYNVFMYDQRGHGLSFRETDDINLLHVEHFSDYVKDLSLFIDTVVLKNSKQPICLFAHSMGCATAALYLAACGDKIKKAVFSAPMFEPNVGDVPVSIARVGTRFAKTFYGSKKRFPSSKDFDPNVSFKNVHDKSRVRFEHNLKLRLQNKRYQTTPMSCGWVDNSLRVRSQILNPKTLNKITTPILLLSAENDRVVNAAPQQIFARKLKKCKFVKLYDATHGLLTGEHELIKYILELTFSFFD